MVIATRQRYLILPVVFCQIWFTQAFFNAESSPSLRRCLRTRNEAPLHALTDRQQQFWGDVDKGLVDIGQYYEKRNQSIDRIRAFCESAKGLSPKPEGYAVGHLPSEEHIAGLTAKPFWDVRDHPELFPWAMALEESADVIREELMSKLRKDEKLFNADSAWQSQIMGSGWKAIRLQRLGMWNVATCKKFPKTYEILKKLQIPLAVRGVCFARQTPGSGVAEHSDGRNFILTAHLGLEVPEGCWIEVGGVRGGWREGYLTTVDTSFKHATGNPSDQERHVLIIDFWHPELTEAEKSSLEFIYDLRNKFESGQVPFRKPTTPETKSDFGDLWKKIRSFVDT